MCILFYFKSTGCHDINMLFYFLYLADAAIITTAKYTTPGTFHQSTGMGQNSKPTIPYTHTEKQFTSSNSQYTMIDNPYSKSNKPNTKRDKPYTKSDNPYIKGGKPFTKSDKPYTKSDKPYTKSDSPYTMSDNPNIKGGNSFTESDKPYTKSNKSITEGDNPMTRSNRPYQPDTRTYTQSNKPYSQTTSEPLSNGNASEPPVSGRQDETSFHPGNYYNTKYDQHASTTESGFVWNTTKSNNSSPVFKAQLTAVILLYELLDL